MSTQHYCENCGDALDPDWQFCENCGSRVALPSPAPVASPPSPRPPAAPPPDSPPVATQKRQSRSWWIPVLGVGCLGLICVGVLAIGGYFYFQSQPASPQVLVEPPEATTIPEIVGEPTTVAENPPTQTSIAPAEETSPTEEAPTPLPTDLPTPTEAPPTESPAEADDDLTGNQRREETAIFDDFSSKALGWAEFDDGITIIKYENEAYSIQVTELGYYDWVYVPVDFSPNSISFDVWGLPGQQDGTFGLMCQYQDMDNHYYLEFDLGTNEFMISKNQAGEQIPLTMPDDTGQYWQKADPLNSSPDQVNRISVECYLDFILLAINDSLVYATEVSDPFTNPGDMVFFVYAFSFAGPNGYKVFFDNVEAYWVVE